VVHPGAAAVLGKRDAGQSQFGGLPKYLARETAGFVEFFGVWLYFRFRKFADALLQKFLLFREFEVQAFILVRDSLGWCGREILGGLSSI